MDDAGHWLLTAAERGNPATDLDRRRPGGAAWSTGNRARPLVHGATYFARLYEELCALRAGDRVYFTDWRGDPDERLLPDGPTVAEVLRGLAASGVEVRGLIWRSHSDLLSFSARSNRVLDQAVNDAGGCALLDQRVRPGGSHHQKLFVCRHRDEPERDVAFVGGIDLCYSRRDDANHEGDPQQQPMDAAYGPRAPWHDVQLELRGPVVEDVVHTFAERWNDQNRLDRRSPISWFAHRRAHQPLRPPRLPDRWDPPPQAGDHVVQLLRTYAARRPPYPFAPAGERSVARGYAKALTRARSLVYVEDQYLWNVDIAEVFAAALRRAPGLRLIAVVPRYPDSNGRFMGPPNRIGQQRALDLVRAAGGDRVAVFDIENDEGVPVYVHAKVCVIDDVWATVGSDNFNRRSWTHDSELTCAVLDPARDPREPTDPGGLGDGARGFARDLRLTLWAEHLGRSVDDPALLDPGPAVELWRDAAAEVQRWWAGGRRGRHPAPRVREHQPQPVSGPAAVWAAPLYRVMFDPDGRPRGLRGGDRF